MTQLKTTLPIEGPYHLGRTLSVLSVGKGNPCLRVSDHQAQLALNTPAGRVAIAATHRTEQLHIVAQGPAADWIEPHLPGLFGLLDNTHEFVPSEPIKQLAQANHGLRLPRLPVVFDRLVPIVLQQLIAFRDACRAWRLMAQRLGEEVSDSQGLFFPPTPQQIARLATYELMECEAPPMHAKRILGLAKHAARLEELWGAGESTDAIDRLCDCLIALPGVGPWTVGMLRGAGLGDSDAVVLGDYGLPHHVAHFFTGAERSDDDEMLRLLDPYRPHRFRVVTMLIQSATHPPRRGPRRASLRERFK